jgi:hypothetical protein
MGQGFRDYGRYLRIERGYGAECETRGAIRHNRRVTMVEKQRRYAGVRACEVRYA